MIQTEDTRKMVYNLILDLNTLTQMVHKQSTYKFRTASIIYKKIIELDVENNKSDKAYDKLLHEIISFFMLPDDGFWNMIKNPNNYEDEIQFYKNDNLEEEYIDVQGIISRIAEIVKSVEFWKAIHRMLDKWCTETAHWSEAEEFAKRMKNNYISILEPAAKAVCIEVSKALDQFTKSK